MSGSRIDIPICCCCKLDALGADAVVVGGDDDVGG